jgi:hypothetical protein
MLYFKISYQAAKIGKKFDGLRVRRLEYWNNGMKSKRAE